MRMTDRELSLVIDAQNGSKGALNELRDIFYDDLVEVIVNELGSGKKVDAIIRSAFKNARTSIMTLRHPAEFEEMIVYLTREECRRYDRGKKKEGRVSPRATTVNPYADRGYPPEMPYRAADGTVTYHDGFTGQAPAVPHGAPYAAPVNAGVYARQNMPYAAPAAPVQEAEQPIVQPQRYAQPVDASAFAQQKVPYAAPAAPVQEAEQPIVQPQRYAQPVDISAFAQQNVPFATPVPMAQPPVEETPFPAPVEEDPKPEEIAAPQAPAPEPAVTEVTPKVGLLVCTKGDNAGENFSLTAGENRIGVTDACDIRLTDDTVPANLSFAVTYQELRESFILQPPASSMLLLNGDRVVSAVFLKAHDAIRVGKTELMLVPFQ